MCERVSFLILFFCLDKRAGFRYNMVERTAVRRSTQAMPA